MNPEKPDFTIRPISDDCSKPRVYPLTGGDLSRRALLGGGVQLPVVLALLDGSAEQLGAAPLTIPLAHSTSVLALAIAPDGATLASGAGNHELKIWALRGAQPEPRRVRTVPEELCSLSFSPDGKLLACGFRGGAVELRTTPPCQH